MSDEVDDPWDAHIDQARAVEVLGGLGPHHRVALTLRYVDGLSVPEVAGILDRTLHATEALLVRARVAFRSLYEKGKAMAADPFEALRRPSPSRRPRVGFAVALRRRLEEELHMTTTDDQLDVEAVRIPAMVHLGVADADRAIRFFGLLFDWEAERVEYRGHIRHYVYNTVNVTPCITDEAGAPRLQLGFTVDDVPATARLVTELGGAIMDDESTPDGGGFVLARDAQGIPLQLWRASGDSTSTRPSRSRRRATSPTS